MVAKILGGIVQAITMAVMTVISFALASFVILTVYQW